MKAAEGNKSLHNPGAVEQISDCLWKQKNTYILSFANRGFIVRFSVQPVGMAYIFKCNPIGILKYKKLSLFRLLKTTIKFG